MKGITRRLLPNNTFIRGVLVLGGASVGGQVISILSAPLLTRIYSAQDFGVLAIFVAILTSFSVVSSLRYELAIPIADDDTEAIHLASISILIAGLISILSFLVIKSFYQQIPNRIQVLADYSWLLAVGLFLLSIYQVLEYFAIRLQSFPIIAKAKLIQAVSSVTIKILGATLGPLALVLGDVAGYTSGMLAAAALLFNQFWNHANDIRIEKIYTVCQKYRKFPLFATWGGLLNIVGNQLPAILFVALFSTEVAGMYALANRVLSLPMTLVGKAIGNVFFSEAAEAQKTGKIKFLVAQVHQKLTQIAMPPTLVLAAVGPDLFAWVFGSEWREAGIFAQLMTPMLYFQFIVSPIAILFNVLNRQEQSMFLQGCMLAIRCSTLFVGSLIGDIRFTISLFALGSAVSYLAFLLWIFKLLGNNLLSIIRMSLKTLVASLLITSPLIITSFLEFKIYINIAALVLTIFMIAMWYSALLRESWS